MKSIIPKMSKTERMVWIRACEHLLRWYKTVGWHLFGCPFCPVAIRYRKEKERVCSHCVWVWFTGYECQEYTENKKYKYSIEYLRNSRHPCWTRNRIRQLTRWIEMLEK